MSEFETPAAALAHYGKKGMRWGVRNAKPTSSQIATARAKNNLGTGTPQDKVTARYLKKGEKITLGVLALSGVATIPIAAGVAGNAAQRRSMQKHVQD